MSDNDRKKITKKKGSLACVSCRKRKVKCNIGEKFPCTGCALLGTRCVKSTIDKRKERSESEYVQKLEARLKMYEDENSRISGQLENIATVMKELSTINSSYDCNKGAREVNTISDNNKDETIGIESTSFNRPTSEETTINYDESDKSANLNDKYPTPVSFKEFNNKFLSVYGPTSVFDSISVSKIKDNKEIQEIDLLNRNPKILEYIKLFFIWQYPDIHIFIFREAFLLDFFHAKTNSSYCSKELIFAICAFGSLFSDDPIKRAISAEFYEKSKGLCFQNYYKPSISLLQSFLLLGLYDIYNGRNDSGWMLSGMAIRIGYSIGLQSNLKEWITDKEFDAKGELGTKIRSRIFWGTYLVDHLIGLLLGRPSSLKMNDTTIEETIELPDIDWIHEYSFQGTNDNNKILRIGDPLRVTVGLMHIAENMLKDIFNTKDKSVEFYEKLLMVKKYNKEIFEWRKGLVQDLSWDSSELENIARDPTTLTFKLLYYIVILCLNRPFLYVGANEVFDEYRQTFYKICSSAINDLTVAIKTTVQTYGFERCSTLIVYCCVISISVILRTTATDIDDRFKQDGPYKFKILLFMMTLKKCASIWGLSEKAYELIRLKLMQDYKIDIDSELQNFDPTQEVSITPSMISDDLENMLFGIEEDNIQERLNNIVEDTDLIFANIEQMISREDTFGGPPIFMTSNTFSNLDNLFTDGNIDPFDYEV